MADGVYVNRDVLADFHKSAVAQQADLIRQNIEANTPAPPSPILPPPVMPSPAPPPIPVDPAPAIAPPVPPTSDASSSPAPAGSSDSTASSPASLTPPPLDQFLAQSGLGSPSLNASPLAPGAGASDQTTSTTDTTSGPPSLQDFLKQSGLGGAVDAVGNAAGAVSSTVQHALGGGTASDQNAPPALSDFLRQSGLSPEQPPAAVNPTPDRQDTAAAPGTQQSGYVFPVPNWTGGKVQDHWGEVKGGSDLMAARGTPVVAMDGGKVLEAGWNSVGGNSVLIQGNDGNQYYYAHFDKAPSVSVGQTIDPGTYLGPVGNTGDADHGPTHLHIGIGPSILLGADKNGGTGGNFDAVGLLQSALDGTQRQVANTAAPSSATPTTAGLSGGGDLAGRIGDAGMTILKGGAQAASWLGDQGQKATQAILVTEGGLNGARGDQGRSAGPLQFFEGGQLANIAGQLGMSLDQAKTWVEQNPVEAVKWAIGTPDKPGYLGQAIADGIQRGLSGADLATYAQQHGQVSVSPERAGANFNALFGNGGGPVTGGTSTDTQSSPWQGLADTAGNLVKQGSDLINGLTPTDQTNPQDALNRQTDQRMAALRQSLDQTTAQTGQPTPSNSDSSTIGAGLPPTPPNTGGQGDQNPLQRWGQQLTQSIVGLIQHISGQPSTDSSDTNVAGQTVPGAPTPSDSLTNPTLRPVGSTDMTQSPAAQPTVFDQVQNAVRTAVSGAGDVITAAAGGLPDIKLAQPDANSPLGAEVAGQPVTPIERLQAVPPLFQGYESSRQQAVENLNPVKDVPLVGGAVNMIASVATDPVTYMVGGPIDSAVKGALAQLMPNAAPAVIKAAAEHALTGFGWGLTQGTEAPDATVQSVLNSGIQGAALNLGVQGVTGSIGVLRDALNTPEVQAALQSRQPAQADVNFATGGLGGLMQRLAGYPAETRQGLEDFVQKQAAAGQQPEEIGNTVIQWMQDNPPPEGQTPAAAAPSAVDVSAQLGGARSRMTPEQRALRASLRGAPQADPEQFSLPTAPPTPDQQPMTPDEVMQHLEMLDNLHSANESRIDLLENRLANPTPGQLVVERPSWAVGWTNNELAEVAKQFGLNPNQAGWADKIGPGELQQIRESNIKGKGTGEAPQTPAQMRAEIKQLRNDNNQIQAVDARIWENPNATYYAPSVTPTDLPWEYSANGDTAPVAAASATQVDAGAIAPAGGGAPANPNAPSAVPRAAATARFGQSSAPLQPAVATTAATAPAPDDLTGILQQSIDRARAEGRGVPQAAGPVPPAQAAAAGHVAAPGGLPRTPPRLAATVGTPPTAPPPPTATGGVRPPAGGAPQGPTGPQPGQAALPGLNAPTPIHPRIQQLLGNHPEYAQIAQDGLNDLQASHANPAQVARFFAGVERSSGLPSGVDTNAWFRSLRNGAMAGGLQTLGHVALNIPLQVLWAVPREVVGATLRGQPEQIPAAAVGLFKGFGAAAEDALQTLRYGITAADAAAGGTARTVFDDSTGKIRSAMDAGNTALPPSIGLRTDNRALQTAANVLTGTVGWHGAAQTFIQKLGFYQKATELAWTQAKSEGLSGSPFSARVSDILNHITDPQFAKMLTEANNYGDRMALRGAQGQVGSALRKFAGAGIGGNLIIPFESIANKVLTGGIEATPVIGALGAGIDAAASRFGHGPYAAGATDVTSGAVTPLSERLANQVLGLGVTAWGMSLAAQGVLKGAGPSNPQERATALDKGEQFDGIQLPNGTFIPGHILGRAWYPLALAANIVEAQKYAKQGATPAQMIEDAVQRMGVFFENETFLRQVADVAAAMKDPSGKLFESLAASQGESLIPQNALARDIGSAMDPSARVAAPSDNPLTAIGNRIEAQLPVLRRDQPPRINATTGYNTPNRSGIIGSVLHPGLPTDPVATEALRLEMAGQPVGITQPKATYEGGTQSPEQLTSIQRAAGQAVQLYATHVLNDPMYSELNDAQKADALRSALGLASKVTNARLGDTISRGPDQSALLQWAQTPHYLRVSGTPQEIAEQNLRIEEARAKLGAYTTQYGPRGATRLRADDPAAYALATHSQPINSVQKKRLQDAIDQATGGALSRAASKAATGGLVGVGSSILDVP